MTRIQCSKRRNGSALLLFCLLLPVMLIMVAFAVDYGFILVGQQQLQNAADAGAMAGGSAMTQGESDPLAIAASVVEANSCVGDQIETDNGQNNAQDVQFGIWDAETRGFTPLTLSLIHI